MLKIRFSFANIFGQIGNKFSFLIKESFNEEQSSFT